MKFTLPFLIVGIILNILYPSFFSLGSFQGSTLKIISALILVAGVTIWVWSVFLILINVPKKKLITEGPYLLVKHPIYISVALFILPWASIIYDSWLGIVVGIVLFIGSRKYLGEEEKKLSKRYGVKWKQYTKKVKVPWL